MSRRVMLDNREVGAALDLDGPGLIRLQVGDLCDCLLSREVAATLAAQLSAALVGFDAWHQAAPRTDDVLGAVNARRIRDGLSWRQVARQIGCGVSTLSRWSGGQGLPSAATLDACRRWLAQETP